MKDDAIRRASTDTRRSLPIRSGKRSGRRSGLGRGLVETELETSSDCLHQIGSPRKRFVAL
jgi:hypothetical protein